MRTYYKLDDVLFQIIKYCGVSVEFWRAKQYLLRRNTVHAIQMILTIEML